MEATDANNTTTENTMTYVNSNTFTTRSTKADIADELFMLLTAAEEKIKTNPEPSLIDATNTAERAFRRRADRTLTKSILRATVYVLASKLDWIVGCEKEVAAFDAQLDAEVDAEANLVHEANMHRTLETKLTAIRAAKGIATVDTGFGGTEEVFVDTTEVRNTDGHMCVLISPCNKFTSNGARRSQWWTDVDELTVSTVRPQRAR